MPLGAAAAPVQVWQEANQQAASRLPGQGTAHCPFRGANKALELTWCLPPAIPQQVVDDALRTNAWKAVEQNFQPLLQWDEVAAVAAALRADPDSEHGE